MPLFFQVKPPFSMLLWLRCLYTGNTRHSRGLPMQDRMRVQLYRFPVITFSLHIIFWFSYDSPMLLRASFARGIQRQNPVVIFNGFAIFSFFIINISQAQTGHLCGSGHAHSLQIIFYCLIRVFLVPLVIVAFLSSIRKRSGSLEEGQRSQGHP